MNQSTIRRIESRDNPILAKIVRDTLVEFKANHPNTVYYDPSTDHLYQLFQVSGAAYFVGEIDGQVVGGGGIYPTDGLPKDTCELVKMYLLPHARGVGLGRKLIQLCLDYAAGAGYRQVYLETMPELQQALKTYERSGFKYLDAAMGNSGHTGCQLWMLKILD